jgi:glycine/D-amino acid oxidase-like deaminating enzyme
MRFDGPVLHQPDGAGRIDADHAVAALTAAAQGHGAHIRPTSSRHSSRSTTCRRSSPDPDRPRTLDPDALARLQDHVATWLPGLDATRPRPVGATWATPSSGEFFLERRGPLLVAAGLGSRGFAHAPQVGSTLAALATDREPATVGR